MSTLQSDGNFVCTDDVGYSDVISHKNPVVMVDISLIQGYLSVIDHIHQIRHYRLLRSHPMKNPPASTATETKRLLSIREAATYLGIGRTSLYKLMNSGVLATISPIPHRKLLLESDLNTFIDSKRM